MILYKPSKRFQKRYTANFRNCAFSTTAPMVGFVHAVKTIWIVSDRRFEMCIERLSISTSKSIIWTSIGPLPDHPSALRIRHSERKSKKKLSIARPRLRRLKGTLKMRFALHFSFQKVNLCTKVGEAVSFCCSKIEQIYSGGQQMFNT